MNLDLTKIVWQQGFPFTCGRFFFSVQAKDVDIPIPVSISKTEFSNGTIIYDVRLDIRDCPGSLYNGDKFNNKESYEEYDLILQCQISGDHIKYNDYIKIILDSSNEKELYKKRIDFLNKCWWFGPIIIPKNIHTKFKV